ncbi:hypothetical protein [Pseudonocardia kunmingensis]|nr:hypothetical protein [Pseudonocardia kunmingensis]
MPCFTRRVSSWVATFAFRPPVGARLNGSSAASSRTPARSRRFSMSVPM